MYANSKRLNLIENLYEKTTNNCILWFVDLSIGSLPLLIKMLIVNNMGKNYQLPTDWLILFLVITIGSFFRCVAPKTNNKSCITEKKNEIGGLILTIIFIYTLSFTIVLYVSELIGVKMIQHYWKCVFFNIFFSLTCTILTPKCTHLNES